MSDSGVEFPLDFSAITEELKRQSKEMGAADKQLDAFQAKSAEFTRKKDSIARQMQRQRERAFMGAVRGAAKRLSELPSEYADLTAFTKSFIEKQDEDKASVDRKRGNDLTAFTADFIARKDAADDEAFWSDRVGRAKSSVFQRERLASVPGSGASSAGAASFLRPAITGSLALGAAAAAAGFAVRSFGQILASESAAKKNVFEKEADKRVSLGRAAAMLNMNPQALMAMANQSGDVDGFTRMASSLGRAHFERRAFMGGNRFQMAADAAMKSGDYSTATDLALQGNFPALARMASMDLGPAAREAQDKIRQQSNFSNRWRVDAYDRGDTFRLAMSEEEKNRLAVEAPYSKWIGDQLGGGITEWAARRNVDYNISNGGYTNTLSGMPAPMAIGPTSPTPQVPAGLPVNARYPDMGQAAQAMTGAAQAIQDAANRRAPRIDTTGATGWGMQ